MSNLLTHNSEDQSSTVEPEDASKNTAEDAGAEKNEDLTPCDSQPSLSSNSSESCAMVSDDKNFTTAYGMVVWPTLPGLSTTSTIVAPPAKRQAGSVRSEAGSLQDSEGGKQQLIEQGLKQDEQKEGQQQTQQQHSPPKALAPDGRASDERAGDAQANNSDAWSQQRAQRGKPREASRRVSNVCNHVNKQLIMWTSVDCIAERVTPR